VRAPVHHACYMRVDQDTPATHLHHVCESILLMTHI
jgi:hypothetical protein